MHVTDSAYIAVLENKLQQSERNLYEFRQIFMHWTKERLVETETSKVERTATLLRNEDGSYPGQLPSIPIEDTECLE